MSYYGQGDYYGQGGLGSFLGGALKTVARAATGFVTGGPAGAIGGVVSSLVPSSRPAPGGGLQIPSVTVRPGAFLPGGTPLVSFGKKRRRMNYANGRALARANRRVDGFVRLARKSLQHTGYKIVSKSAGKRPVNIRESGPGSVNVRG